MFFVDLIDDPPPLPRLLLAQPSTLPTHHLLGNHCLDVPKAHIMTRLRIPATPPTAYYTAPLAPGWRLVVLDTTEMSGHSQAEPGSVAEREAAEYLAAHPLNDDNPQSSDWNGGCTSVQLAWLADVLDAAAAAGERVIVAGHHQAGPGASVRRSHAAWNHAAIRAVLTRPASPVVLYLAGHDHEGGYEAGGGVHWVTVEAMCEAPPGSNAYCVVHCHGDRVEVEGVGSVTSRMLKL